MEELFVPYQDVIGYGLLWIAGTANNLTDLSDLKIQDGFNRCLARHGSFKLLRLKLFKLLSGNRSDHAQTDGHAHTLTLGQFKNTMHLILFRHTRVQNTIPST